MSNKDATTVAKPELSNIQLTPVMGSKPVAPAQHHRKNVAGDLLDPEERLAQEDLAILDGEVSNGVAERVILAQADGNPSDAAPAAAGSAPTGSGESGGTATGATATSQGNSSTGAASGDDSFNPGVLLVAGAVGIAAAAGGGGGGTYIAPDTAPPAAPAINIVATDDIINAAETGVAITGTAEANSTVNLTLGTATHAVTTDATGNWSYTLVAADITAMGQGNVTLSATATDAAGNVSLAGTRAIVVDTIVPTVTGTITTVTDNIAPITGNLADPLSVLNGNWTNDTSLDLAGTLSATLGAGEVLAVYDGAVKLGNATVTGTAWTYADATLANGDAVSYTVRVEDAAGNQGTASAAFVTNIDTVAPTATATITQVFDNYGGITGALTSGVGVTDDTSLDLSGTITGTLAANEVVAVYDGAVRLGTATVTGSTWAYTDTSLAVGDVTSYTVQVEDLAGNLGTASTPAFVANIVAPTGTTTISTVYDSVAPIVGNVANGGFTNDGQLNLAGTVTGLTGLQVVGVWDGATRLGSAFTIVDASGNGTWTFLDNRIGTANGHVYSFTTSVEEVNVVVPPVATSRGVSSAVFTATLDTLAPTAAVTGAIDNVGPIIGTLTSGSITDDTLLMLTGTINESNTTVDVYDGATLLGAATVVGTTWTYNAAVANGVTYQFNAVATDAAGLVGAASANFTITGDTTAPTAVSASFANAGATSFQVNFSESVNALGTTGLTVSVNDVTALTLGAVTPGTVVNANDSFTFAFTGAAPTAANYLVLNYDSALGSVTDIAGNPAPSGTIVFGSDGTPGAAGTTIDLVANPLTGTPFSPVAIYTHLGNDSITGTAGAERINAGAGADTINSGGGADTFVFAQGDSTLVTYTDVGASGTLNDGDTFAFTGGADMISGAAAGANISFATATGALANLTSVTATFTGQVGDQQYATVRGDLAGGTFTVNTTAGADVLVVYDGDPTAGVTQTALVLSGSGALALTQNPGQIVIA